MARVSGSWNQHFWKDNKWQTVINDIPYLEVSTQYINMSASAGIVISGAMALGDGDVSATNLSASNDVVATADVRGVNLSSSGDVVAVADVRGVNLSASGDAVITGDVEAAGGYRHAIQFYATQVLQGAVVEMTSSYMSASAGNRFWFTTVPMVYSGSVTGVALRSADGAVDDSSNGAITGSVVVAGTKTTAEVIITTGSWGHTTISKDTSGATVNPGDNVYVVLTASADYLNSVAASCSWVANVIVES